MLQVKSPYDRRLLAEIREHTKEEALAALETAHTLYRDLSRKMPAWVRVQVLEKLATLMRDNLEALTKLAAEEGGKPYTDSKVEVERAIGGVQLAAEEIARVTGEEVPMNRNKASANRLAVITREPIGVVLSLSAFNHPLNLVVHQTVTAIAAGCPVVIKPASATPLSCINIVRLLGEAGLPEGWCQVVICSNEIAETLVSDARVSYLSFIGSAKVGWHLRSKLAPGARCGLEHGGAAPVIIAADAKRDGLVATLVKGGFYHAGQVCVSIQRIFVDEMICDELAAEIAEQAQKLQVGDPLDPATEVGPLIRLSEVDRVHEWVTEAVQRGGRLLCGGKKLSSTCYAPTVVLDPPQDCALSQQEVFGPVVCVYRYRDLDEAIALANSLDLHFQAAVFTRDIDTAMHCARRLNATAVMVNDSTTFRVDWMPFGGRDSSGLGLGGIPYSMREMTREKMIVIHSPDL